MSFKKNTNEPVRLRPKKEPKKEYILIRTQIMQLICLIILILSISLFLTVCLILIPKTSGFYWW